MNTKRTKTVKDCITTLEYWKAYVRDSNECAYTDSMLKWVIDNLTKLYENT